MEREPSPAAPQTPPPEPGHCPNCGARHDPYQEYCLECGRRLFPLAYGRRREVWSRESPLWLWAALLGLLLVALVAGAIVAVAATGDDEEAGGTAPVVSVDPTGGTDTIGVITEPETLTIEPPTTTGATITIPTTTLQDTTTLQTTTVGGLTTWPAGRDGYTIVLRSVPTGQGRGDAEAAARQAQTQGLPQPGVLTSSDYSSLRPGYYVAFSGIYDTLAAAQSALPNARSRGFPLAYVREISD